MKDFNFGDVSGSEESQEPKFQDLFYDEDSKIENQVNSKKKFIIYGRKGTGKTLLASYINEKNKKVHNRASKVVSYDDYILEKLKEFKYDSVKKEEQSLFWRYVFLQQFTDLIKDDFKELHFWQFFKKYKIKKFIKNVIVRLFKKSANILPTIGTSKNAFTEGKYFSVTACIFAIAFGVAPIPKPQVPAASTTAS